MNEFKRSRKMKKKTDIGKGKKKEFKYLDGREFKKKEDDDDEKKKTIRKEKKIKIKGK